MPSYDSTARVPFATGGKVGSKKPKVKRIILWKGKAKDWPGAKKAAEQTRNRKAEGGIASIQDFTAGGHAMGPGTGTSDSIPAFLSDFNSFYLF